MSRRFAVVALALVPVLLLGACAGPPESPPNILLVSLDTLRADYLEESPYLSRLAREGRRFDAAYASSNWTLPSHASLFTSLPYGEHGLPIPGSRAPHGGLALPAVPTLAEVLSAGGWTTAASTEGGWLLPRFGLDRGFQTFTTTAPVSAGGSTDFEDHLAAARQVASGGDPFFLFVHTYRVHDYFVNDSRYHDLLLPGDASYAAMGNLRRTTAENRPPADFVQRLYKAGVGRTDAFLEQLVGTVLKASGGAPLLVVVTSDHGENLGEEGYWGHGLSLDDVQLLVPLVAWSSTDEVTQGVVDLPVSTVDVAPSIVGWLGQAVPPAWRGRADLLTGEPGSAAVFARHHGVGDPEQPWDGAVHQLLVEDGLRLERHVRYDGTLNSSLCQRFNGDATECPGLDRDLRRSWGHAGGALRVRSTGAVDLVFESLADQVGAVLTGQPSSGALLEVGSGRLRFEPSWSDDFLLIYPRGEFRLLGVEVEGEVLSGLLEVEDLATPRVLSHAGGEVVLHFPGSRGEGSADVAPEVLEQLRALGYLD